MHLLKNNYLKDIYILRYHYSTNVIACLVGLLTLVQVSLARIANPFPVAVVRQNDIYLIESKEKVKQLTDLGDVQEICWLDNQTICFSRKMATGITTDRRWRGFGTIWDLFTVRRDGTDLRQFTANHFAREPSPAPLERRALFWRDNRALGTISEIWEAVYPRRRDAPLGIRGIAPDSSPDKRWTAASLGSGEAEGVGLYRYPTNDSYRKLRGPYHRPRFSPDSKLLTYLSEESGQAEIWGYDMPDGEPGRLLGIDDDEKFAHIVDFGWVGDGSGYILLLEDGAEKVDAYYWEIQKKILQKLTDWGDVQKATSWH